MIGPNPEFWRAKRVFISGHTGFKGSWLCLLLQHWGAELKGYALEPSASPALFTEANVAEGMTSELGDVRNLEALTTSMIAFEPEVVIHMAAQPLVRLSYYEPVETYEVNVMGTVNLLEAVRHCPSVKAVVNVTTDKCYENREWVWGYRENEPMGGRDPYSSSKGCSELVTSAYRSSFFSEASSTTVATARAGNVIGGGDWAVDRLIPDILRAFESSLPVVIRNPKATRPWQHVLEPISGYLLLAERLYSDGHQYAGGWNFGPVSEDAKTVDWILDFMVVQWGEGAHWELDEEAQPHEAQLLKLDISKASHRLNWRPRWDLSKTLNSIIDWHQSWLAGHDVKQTTLRQISHYFGE
jgi:CDP-glucose 4,6-dehydratase